jgi:tetratricopeptide (TPR) repeat protein
VLLAALWLAACDGGAEREAAYLKRGKTLFEESNYIKARLEFKNALQINPKGIDGKYYLALIDEAEGNLQEAFIGMTRLVEQHPEHVPVQVKLGQYFLLSNELEKAREKADVILSLEPRNPDGHALRGAVLLRRGALQEARSEIDTARQTEPGNVGAISVLAGIYQKQGNIEQALEILSEGVKLNPKNKALRLLSIQLHLEANDFSEVEATYRELFALDPGSHRYRTALAKLYVRRGQLDAAEKLLRQSITVAPDDSKRKLLLIDFLANQRGRADAEEQLRGFIEETPEDYQLQFGLGELYIKHKAQEKAEALYRDIIARDGKGPHGLRARGEAARIYFRRGETEEAERHLQEILDEDPANRIALLLRGRLALKQGDYQAAIADLRTLLRDDPTSKDGLASLAEAHLRASEFELAIEALRSLVEIDPLNDKALVRLARLLARRGDYDAAQPFLDAVLARSPDYLPALQSKAEISVIRKAWPEAEAAARSILEQKDQQALGHQVLGNVYKAETRYDEAVVEYRKALDLAPTAPEPLTGMVQSYVAGGKAEAAARFLEDRTADEPQDAIAHNLLGEVYLKQQDLVGAEKAFRLAATQRDDWPVPYINLGQLLMNTGDYARASAAYEEGLSQIPDHEELRFSLAVAYEKAGDLDAAIQAYATMLQANPGLDIVANNLAALIADHQFQERARLEFALQAAERFQTSSDPHFLDTLGWVHYRLGNTPEAVIALERAVLAGGGFPQLRYHLGMALYAADRPDRARQELERALADDAEFTGVEIARATLAKL